MAILLDGKKLSSTIQQEIADQVDAMLLQQKRPPHLAAVLVGADGASQTYVANKIKACQHVGFRSTLHQLDATIAESELLALIKTLNQDAELDGYIVQLPLPKHIDERKVLLSISPQKDVDGFHPENFGRMSLGLDSFIPATPYGILEMLHRHHIVTQGKHAVVIGRSHIVGRPISILLSRPNAKGNATVTLCHSHTQNIAALTQQADIVVTALGKPGFLTGKMVRQGAVVIDVGITRVEDVQSTKGYRLVGDVDFDSVAPIASHITPVPGGIGPMTIAMLLKTLSKRASKQWSRDKKK